MANSLINQQYDAIFNTMNFYRDKRNLTRILVEYKKANGYWELQDVKDECFQAYVNDEFRRLTNQEDTSAYNVKLRKYIDKALLSGKKISVKTRLDGTKDETAYFMGNDKNLIIRINKDGYKYLKHSKQYKFLKISNIVEQVKPRKETAQNLLKHLSPFLNMSGGMQILFTVNLVQQFICTSSHFLSVINSPKGTGKSTFMRMWRKIIDPRLSEISIMPTTAEELKNHLANNLVVCFDNTQTLSEEFSDIICGAVTGTTFSKRKLYTDNTELTYELHSTVIMNGISIIPQKSDLLDRSILFTLDKIKDVNRIDEQTLSDKFHKKLPYILGAIFDTLTEYFKIKDSITVTNAHRMSGAYRDCYVIATVLGVSNEFVEAFEANQGKLHKGYADNNVIISAISSYFEANRGRSEIKDLAEKVYHILWNYSDKTSFPKSPSAFSRKLTDEADNLLQAGFIFDRAKKGKGSQITITKIKRRKK